MEAPVFLVPPALQAFPPRAARFCLALERFCRRDLGVSLRGASLLIAFSGGADSLALLYALHALTPRLKLRLGLAILDHGLRAESGAEVEGARYLAERLGIAFVTERSDVAAQAAAVKVGLEEAGRDARYAFLRTAREEGRYDWVVLGHQLNDLAEDSLMRLIRGSGWPGLAGMAGVDAARVILRPMLLTPRREIEAFLSALGASWICDPMNADPHYLRGRVRHELLPLFLRENPAFLEQVAQRWHLARLDDNFFQEQLEVLEPAACPATSETIFLEPDLLRPLPPALRLRLLKRTLDALGPGQIRAATLLALDTAWQKGEGGKTFAFPGQKKATLYKGGITCSLEFV